MANKICSYFSHIYDRLLIEPACELFNTDMSLDSDNHIETLPDELLLHILSFLPLSSLYQVQQVNTTFRGISRDFQLWPSHQSVIIETMEVLGNTVLEQFAHHFDPLPAIVRETFTREEMMKHLSLVSQQQCEWQNKISLELPQLTCSIQQIICSTYDMIDPVALAKRFKEHLDRNLLIIWNEAAKQLVDQNLPEKIPTNLKGINSTDLADHAKSIREWMQGHRGILERIILLNCFSMDLTGPIPAEISFFSKLEVLCLENNQLTSLPGSIGNLDKLKCINLSGNQLDILPDSIGNLDKLEVLCLENNQLTSLPGFIGNLDKLEKLDLRVNWLTSLPDSIGNLDKLKDLDLGFNKLVILPDSIGNLDKLEKLDLKANWLTSLPDSIGNLDKLKDLDLCVNKLDTLPKSLNRLKGLRIGICSGMDAVLPKPFDKIRTEIPHSEIYFTIKDMSKKYWLF